MKIDLFCRRPLFRFPPLLSIHLLILTFLISLPRVLPTTSSTFTFPSDTAKLTIDACQGTPKQKKLSTTTLHTPQATIMAQAQQHGKCKGSLPRRGKEKVRRKDEKRGAETDQNQCTRKRIQSRTSCTASFSLFWPSSTRHKMHPLLSQNSQTGCNIGMSRPRVAFLLQHVC